MFIYSIHLLKSIVTLYDMPKIKSNLSKISRKVRFNKVRLNKVRLNTVRISHIYMTSIEETDAINRQKLNRLCMVINK